MCYSYKIGGGESQMVNPFFILLGIVFFILYGGLNYYIGLRGWQALFSYIPFVSPKLYWVVFGMISLSYLFGRLMQKFLSKGFYEGLNLVGAYWMAFMFYFLLVIAALDLLRLINHFLRLVPIKQSLNPTLGLIVFILVLGIVGYGAWNARHPRVNHYDITIAKQAGTLKQLHVVMVSDIHLGTIIHNGYLTKMVGMVNQLQPDLVLFAGDVFDENLEAVNKQEMTDALNKLKAQYGAFAVLGNHEYIGGNAEEAVKYLSAAGVRVLKDSAQEIDGSFYPELELVHNLPRILIYPDFQEQDVHWLNTQAKIFFDKGRKDYPFRDLILDDLRTLFRLLPDNFKAELRWPGP